MPAGSATVEPLAHAQAGRRRQPELEDLASPPEQPDGSGAPSAIRGRPATSSSTTGRPAVDQRLLPSTDVLAAVGTSSPGAGRGRTSGASAGAARTAAAGVGGQPRRSARRVGRGGHSGSLRQRWTSPSGRTRQPRLTRRARRPEPSGPAAGRPRIRRRRPPRPRLDRSGVRACRRMSSLTPAGSSSSARSSWRRSFYVGRDALRPFVVGLILAYLLDIPVERMARLGMPRWVSVLIVYAVFAVLFVLAIRAHLPAARRRDRDIHRRLPDVRRPDHRPVPAPRSPAGRSRGDRPLAAEPGQGVGGIDPGDPAAGRDRDRRRPRLDRRVRDHPGLGLLPDQGPAGARERGGRHCPPSGGTTRGRSRGSCCACSASGSAARCSSGWSVGVATFIGLMVLSVLVDPVFGRFAVLLSVIAGVLELLPIIGPIIAAIPAVVLGADRGHRAGDRGGVAVPRHPAGREQRPRPEDPGRRRRAPSERRHARARHGRRDRRPARRDPRAADHGGGARCLPVRVPPRSTTRRRRRRRRWRSSGAQPDGRRAGAANPRIRRASRRADARGADVTDTVDAYKVLQVDPEAEDEVIQAAYRRLAQKYHPDRRPDADGLAPDGGDQRGVGDRRRARPTSGLRPRASRGGAPRSAAAAPAHRAAGRPRAADVRRRARRRLGPAARGRRPARRPARPPESVSRDWTSGRSYAGGGYNPADDAGAGGPRGRRPAAGQAVGDGARGSGGTPAGRSARSPARHGIPRVARPDGRSVARTATRSTQILRRPGGERAARRPPTARPFRRR